MPSRHGRRQTRYRVAGVSTPAVSDAAASARYTVQRGQRKSHAQHESRRGGIVDETPIAGGVDRVKGRLSPLTLS